MATLWLEYGDENAGGRAGAGSSVNLTGVCRNLWFEGRFVAAHSLQCACSLQNFSQSLGHRGPACPFARPWGARAPLQPAPCRHLGPAAPPQQPWQEACSTLTPPDSKLTICVQGQIQVSPTDHRGTVPVNISLLAPGQHCTWVRREPATLEQGTAHRWTAGGLVRVRGC